MAWFLASLLLLSVIAACEVEWEMFRRRIHPWLVQHATLLGAYRSIVAFVAFPLALLGGVFTYFQIIERLEHPSVALELRHPASVAVSVVNTSASVVRDPKYGAILFNLDEADEKLRLEPLPIPVNGGDYIRAGDTWGPSSMMSISTVNARVSPGSRVIGFMSVTCPTCATKSYRVSFKHGEGGWYAEMGAQSGLDYSQLAKLLRTPDEVQRLFEAAVPAEARVAIR